MFEKGNHPKEKHQRETQLTCIPLLLERSCGGREEFTKTQLLIPFHTQKQNEQTDSKGIDCVFVVYTPFLISTTPRKNQEYFSMCLCVHVCGECIREHLKNNNKIPTNRKTTTAITSILSS